MENELVGNKFPCPNCQHELMIGDAFCVNCGQKVQKRIPKLWELISDFFDSVLNIDSKIIRTFRAIFIPGQLSIHFFKGIRKKYYHPFRLFFFVAVLFFTLLGTTDLKKIMKDGFHVGDFETKKNEFLVVKKIEEVSDTVIGKFSQKKLATEVLDSLKNQFVISNKDSSDFTFMGSRTYKFAQNDIFLYDEKELIERYEVTEFLDKLFVKQSLKAVKDPAGFSWYIMGNFVWMLILLMPAVALSLKILYIRRKRYFVEHLTFLFHFHAFVFFLSSIVLIIAKYYDHNWVYIIAGSYAPIYLYLAMKRFYKQGWIKTFIKFWILGISYVFLSIVFLLILALISLAIY